MQTMYPECFVIFVRKQENFVIKGENTQFLKILNNKFCAKKK